MDAQIAQNNELEFVDLDELIAALEKDIMKGKETLSRLSADDELVF